MTRIAGHRSFALAAAMGCAQPQLASYEDRSANPGVGVV
jgi:hypothetical protein